MRGYGDNEPGPEVRDPKRKNIFHKDPCWDVREDIDVCSQVRVNASFIKYQSWLSGNWECDMAIYAVVKCTRYLNEMNDQYPKQMGASG